MRTCEYAINYQYLNKVIISFYLSIMKNTTCCSSQVSYICNWAVIFLLNPYSLFHRCECKVSNQTFITKKKTQAQDAAWKPPKCNYKALSNKDVLLFSAAFRGNKTNGVYRSLVPTQSTGIPFKVN